MKLMPIYNIAYGENHTPINPMEARPSKNLLFSAIVVNMIEKIKNPSRPLTGLDAMINCLSQIDLGLDDIYYFLDKVSNSKFIDQYLIGEFTASPIFKSFHRELKEKIGVDSFSAYMKGAANAERVFTLSQLFFKIANDIDFLEILNPENNADHVDLTYEPKAEFIKAFAGFMNSSLQPEIEHFFILSVMEKVIKDTPEQWRADYIKLLNDCSIPGFVEYVERVNNILKNKGHEFLQGQISDVNKADEFFSYSPSKNLPQLSTRESNQESSDEMKVEHAFASALVSGSKTWENVQKLGEHIIGQKNALEKVKSTMLGSFIGFRDPNKPLASFLFTGPTGVGKTFTAKDLANLCFGGNMHTVDMSTFKHESDINRLTGSPAGFVGYSDKNEFCEFIKNNPRSVILFDEIDKAHPSCLDLFMRMLDEGEFINSKGETVSLRECVIICTTNLTEYVKASRPLGFTSSDKNPIENVEEDITGSDGLRKELVARYDAVVRYEKLTKEDCMKIAKIEVDKIVESFEKSNEPINLRIKYGEKLLEKVVEDAKFELLGARAIKPQIRKTIITPVINEVMKNPDDVKNTTFNVTDEGLQIKKESATTKKVKEASNQK